LLLRRVWREVTQAVSSSGKRSRTNDRRMDPPWVPKVQRRARTVFAIWWENPKLSRMADAVSHVDVIRAGAATRDAVVVEEPLEIRLDDKPVYVTMRTPGHDFDLAVGFVS
jgi:hypothetical protein